MDEKVKKAEEDRRAEEEKKVEKKKRRTEKKAARKAKKEKRKLKKKAEKKKEEEEEKAARKEEEDEAAASLASSAVSPTISPTVSPAYSSSASSADSEESWRGHYDSLMEMITPSINSDNICEDTAEAFNISPVSSVWNPPLPPTPVQQPAPMTCTSRVSTTNHHHHHQDWNAPKASVSSSSHIGGNRALLNRYYPMPSTSLTSVSSSATLPGHRIRSSYSADSVSSTYTPGCNYKTNVSMIRLNYCTGAIPLFIKSSYRRLRIYNRNIGNGMIK